MFGLGLGLSRRRALGGAASNPLAAYAANDVGAEFVADFINEVLSLIHI